jgi:hypothetical protein
MLQLSKRQYKDLCTECASKMMVGSGADMSFPSTIPDFEGTDISFWVEDPALDGGGFMDTLKGTYNKVRDYIGSSKLAQDVVKKGIQEGKRIARGVADTAVKAGVEYLPEGLRGPAESLAAEALNKLETKAESAAESAFIRKPSAAQAPTAPSATAPTASTARAERGASSRKRLRGSGYDSGLMAPHPLASMGVATAPAWSNALAPGGSMVTQTPRIAGAY